MGRGGDAGNGRGGREGKGKGEGRTGNRKESVTWKKDTGGKSRRELLSMRNEWKRMKNRVHGRIWTKR